MKSKFITGLLLTLMVMTSMMFTSCGYERVDAGNEAMVFSLNGNNWVTKSLLAIKEILNKKI